MKVSIRHSQVPYNALYDFNLIFMGVYEGALKALTGVLQGSIWYCLCGIYQCLIGLCREVIFTSALHNHIWSVHDIFTEFPPVYMEVFCGKVSCHTMPYMKVFCDKLRCPAILYMVFMWCSQVSYVTIWKCLLCIYWCHISIWRWSYGKFRCPTMLYMVFMRYVQGLYQTPPLSHCHIRLFGRESNQITNP